MRFLPQVNARRVGFSHSAKEIKTLPEFVNTLDDGDTTVFVVRFGTSQHFSTCFPTIFLT